MKNNASNNQAQVRRQSVNQPLPIEAGGEKGVAIIGELKFIKLEEGYGYVATPAGDVRIHVCDFRKVLPGVSLPTFSTGLDLPKFLPFRGTQILMVVLRDGPHRVNAIVWGLASYYVDAVAKIALRPVYKVEAVEDRREGKFIRDNDPLIIEGTSEQIEAKYPRLLNGSRDPVGTSVPYRSGPFSRTNQWFVKDHNGARQMTSDPRPWPKAVVQVVYRIWCGREQVFHGHLGTLLSRGLGEFLGDDFVFEVNRVGLWTEVSDPRENPQAVVDREAKIRLSTAQCSGAVTPVPAMTATPQPSRKPAEQPGAQKPVAMSKKATVTKPLKSLADLGDLELELKS